jgi:hypothetical protein
MAGRARPKSPPAAPRPGNHVIATSTTSPASRSVLAVGTQSQPRLVADAGNSAGKRTNFTHCTTPSNRPPTCVQISFAQAR